MLGVPAMIMSRCFCFCFCLPAQDLNAAHAAAGGSVGVTVDRIKQLGAQVKDGKLTQEQLMEILNQEIGQQQQQQTKQKQPQKQQKQQQNGAGSSSAAAPFVTKGLNKALEKAAAGQPLSDSQVAVLKAAEAGAAAGRAVAAARAAAGAGDDIAAWTAAAAAATAAAGATRALNIVPPPRPPPGNPPVAQQQQQQQQQVVYTQPGLVQQVLPQQVLVPGVVGYGMVPRPMPVPVMQAGYPGMPVQMPVAAVPGMVRGGAVVYPVQQQQQTWQQQQQFGYQQQYAVSPQPAAAAAGAAAADGDWAGDGQVYADEYEGDDYEGDDTLYYEDEEDDGSGQPAFYDDGTQVHADADGDSAEQQRKQAELEARLEQRGRRAGVGGSERSLSGSPGTKVCGSLCSLLSTICFCQACACSVLHCSIRSKSVGVLLRGVQSYGALWYAVLVPFGGPQCWRGRQ
jgi:hypothetical protein